MYAGIFVRDSQEHLAVERSMGESCSASVDVRGDSSVSLNRFTVASNVATRTSNRIALPRLSTV